MKTLTGQIKKINRLSGQLTTPRAAPGGSEFKEVYIDVLTEQFSETLPLTFSTTAEALEDYTIYGNEGGVGDPVNVLVNTVTSQTVNGLTITANDDGSITVTGTASSLTRLYVKNNVTVRDGDSYQTLERKIYVISGAPVGATENGYGLRYNYKPTMYGIPSVGEVPAGDEKIIDNTGGSYTTFAVYLEVQAGVTVNNITFRPKLRVYGTPESGYLIPIKITGKNFFDSVNAEVVASYPNNSSGQVMDGDAHSLVIPLTQGDYTFSMFSPTTQNVRNRFRVVCYSTYPAVGTSAISSVYESGTVRDGDYIYLSFTAPAETAYALAFLWSGSVYTPEVINQIVANNQLQLEHGTERTDYEPYFNETVTVNLGSPLYYDDVVTMSEAGVIIPTAIGTNTLTVETTVQPAAVQVKYQS